MTLSTGQGRARITFAVTSRAKLLGCGFEYVITGTPTPDAVATAIANALTGTGFTGGPALATQTNPDYEWIGVNTSQNTGSGIFDGFANLSIVGTGSGTSLPPNCSLLISKTSGLGNRHGRGRMYVPCYFPNESLVDANGVIDPTYHATLQTNWERFLSNLQLGSPSVIMCVGTGFTTVNALTVQNSIATQRKRLR